MHRDAKQESQATSSAGERPSERTTVFPHDCRTLQRSNHQITSKPGSVLNQHGLHVVVFNPIKQRSESRSVIKLTSAADPFISELIHEPVAVGLRKAVDGVPLPGKTVAMKLYPGSPQSLG